MTDRGPGGGAAGASILVQVGRRWMLAAGFQEAHKATRSVPAVIDRQVADLTKVDRMLAIVVTDIDRFEARRRIAAGVAPPLRLGAGHGN